jgi:hypothetical protein
MKVYLIVGSVLAVLFLFFSACKTGGRPQNKTTDFTLQQGYILFQDLDCGPLCDAIEAVTRGYKGASFSHMGLVVKKESGIHVLEAIGAGVVETPLEDFLGKSNDADGNPKVMVARVKKEYQHLIQGVIEHKNKYLGLPYNDPFILNDSTYYCSQLIHTLFKNANRGQDFFELMPMTFKEPGSDKYFEVWVDYYKELNCEIPEGEPGLNPGGMSCSDKLEAIHFYGVPDGLQNTILYQKFVFP